MKKDSNALFLIIISLFIVIFIIVSYIIFSGNIFDVEDNNNNNNTDSNTELENKCEEVFNLRDNIYTYEEAKAACEAYDSRLATLQELIESHKNGANWCSYGWSEGQMALYPTQQDFWDKLQKDRLRKDECGSVGINGGYFANPHYKFGANCFGVKPNKKEEVVEGSHLLKKRPNSEHNKLVSHYKSKINNLKVSPFNDNNEDGRWYL